jgi:protein TonB
MIGYTASWAVPGSGAASQPAGGTTTAPQLESRVEPVYPPEARDAELEASIILQVVVGKDGTVSPESIQYLRCSVHRRDQEPEEVLHGWCDDFCDASAAAVGQWRYTPATMDGEPVDVYLAVALSFVLQ